MKEPGKIEYNTMPTSFSLLCFSFGVLATWERNDILFLQINLVYETMHSFSFFF